MQGTSHRSYTAFHLRVLNMEFFSYCNAVSCCSSCASYKTLRAQATVPFTPSMGLWIFSLVSSLLFSSLRLELGMPLSPVNPETMNSPSFWQHVVPGMKPTTGSGPKATTGSGPTIKGVSGEAACA